MLPIESAVRNRSPIERCIDEFVEDTRYVPPAACPVHYAHGLTPRLERFAQRLPAAVWRAWSEGVRIWFVHGQFVERSDELADFPAIYLVFLDHDAKPVASGVWHRVAEGQWELIAPLAPAPSLVGGSSRIH